MSTQKLEFSALRIANKSRLETTEKFAKSRWWSTSQWLQALVGELGELANEMKKRDRGDYNAEEAKEKFEKEIADVQIYLDLLAHNLNIDLAKATRDKFNEVSARVDSPIAIGHDGQVYYLPED